MVTAECWLLNINDRPWLMRLHTNTPLITLTSLVKLSAITRTLSAIAVICPSWLDL